MVVAPGLGTRRRDPRGHKDIDQVMADRDDLVEVHHSLRQVLDDKGT